MVTRIRQLLDTKQLTPTQFADFIGVGRPVMSHILSERNKPSLEVVQRIISAFPEISLPWLLSGLGEMLGEAASAAPALTPAAEEPPVIAPPTLSTVVPIEEEATVASNPAEPEVAQPQPIGLAEESAETAPAVAVALPTPAQVAPAAPQVLPAVPRAFATGGGRLPAAKPTPVAAPAVVPPVAAVTIPPFRAARFVPAAIGLPTAAPREAAGADQPAPGVAAVALAQHSLAADGLAASTPSAVPVASKQSPEAALLPFLGEPGKEIRRIVIFYRDGSFADYQPEA